MWRIDRVMCGSVLAPKQFFDVIGLSYRALGYMIHVVSSDGEEVVLKTDDHELIKSLYRYRPYGFIGGDRPKFLSVDSVAFNFLSVVDGVEEIETDIYRWHPVYGDNFVRPLDTECTLWQYPASRMEYYPMLDMFASKRFKYKSHWDGDGFVVNGARHTAWVIHFNDVSRAKRMIEKRRIQNKLKIKAPT